MTEISNFSIGDIVTLKSHPLFKNFLINSFSHQVPPLMLIKEVFFEDKKKKLFSDEIENAQISDLIKYTCVYFNDKKSEFNEILIYHSLLESYEKLKYHKIDDKGKKIDNPTLIKEVKTKYVKAKYVYGKTVQFVTSKLESRKKLETGTNEKSKYPSFTSPDFVLLGIKKEPISDLFYNDGKPKKKISEISYKVIWFNHVQQKFSEKYLPKEFFIDPIR